MKNTRLISITLVFAITTYAPTLGDTCEPGVNCKLPSCRCWDDPNAPGGFEGADIPQMIVISFNYGLNSGNIDRYENLFSGIQNPNGCPIPASFYVTEYNTDFGLAAKLYEEGHELGVNTIAASKIPSEPEEWAGNFSQVISSLVEAGIPKSAIVGASGPSLFFGGDNNLYGLVSNDLLYDTTCGTVRYTYGNFLWPYTYDYIENTPDCTVGVQVTKAFPGIWQFMLAALDYEGLQCATASSCEDVIKSATDAQNLFYDAFIEHYYQKTRPPFLMSIDAQWLTDANRAQGTRKFLELIEDAFTDVWIVTTQQALAWIQSPVSVADALNFEPWSC